MLGKLGKPISVSPHSPEIQSPMPGPVVNLFTELPEQGSAGRQPDRALGLGVASPGKRGMELRTLILAEPEASNPDPWPHTLNYPGSPHQLRRPWLHLWILNSFWPSWRLRFSAPILTKATKKHREGQAAWHWELGRFRLWLIWASEAGSGQRG